MPKHTDTIRLKEERSAYRPIIGETDVMIFAFGADIGDWMPYDEDNEYFRFLSEQGFVIYCNVDSSSASWVQFDDRFMRCARRSMDGYNMYYYPDRLGDLFDVKNVWDETRPTPVPEI